MMVSGQGGSLERGVSEIPSSVRDALDHLAEGFMLIDRQGRIALWNGAFLDMLELPADLFAHGADVLPLIRVLADRGDYGPGDPAILTERIAAGIRSRQPAQGERQMANGTIIKADWIVVSDDHFMFRLTNVTSERSASRFKDELIATVSHELRTPLTAIIGALGLLKGGAGGKTNRQADSLIDMAIRNGARLTRLINDLLDIDRLQSNMLDFTFERTDMALLLAEAVEQNASYAQSLGIAIDLETPDDPVLAEVDRGRILQVMSNLLSNAAKFSPSGSRVRIRLQPGAGGVRISVIDNGRGMSPEFRRRLFTRFAQENRSVEHGQIGTGLGLAISRNITDRHRGQIHADTREGVGTIFHIDLPLRQETA